jgi:hypothetical protein
VLVAIRFFGGSAWESNQYTTNLKTAVIPASCNDIKPLQKATFQIDLLENAPKCKKGRKNWSQCPLLPTFPMGGLKASPKRN